MTNMNKHGIRFRYNKKVKKKKTYLKKDKTRFIELLRLTENTLGYFQKNVKDAQDMTEDQVQRRMTRNMKLAVLYKTDRKDGIYPRRYYAYGNLRFMVRKGRISWIRNNCPSLPMWYLDLEKKEHLNKILKID